MGNANDKILIEQIAKSPAVQNVLHRTAIELARILSSSVVEMCKQIANQPPPQKVSHFKNNNVSINININIQNFDTEKYEKKVNRAMHKMNKQIIDAVVVDKKGLKKFDD